MIYFLSYPVIIILLYIIFCSLGMDVNEGIVNFIKRWFEKRSTAKQIILFKQQRIKKISNQLMEAGYSLYYFDHGKKCFYCKKIKDELKKQIKITNLHGQEFIKEDDTGTFCYDCNTVFTNKKEYTTADFLYEFSVNPIPMRKMYMEELDKLEQRTFEIRKKLMALPAPEEEHPYRMLNQ